MKKEQSIYQTSAKLFMTLISTFGFILVGIHLFHLQLPKDPIILILFAVFLAVCNYYPISVGQGNTTVNFPIVYILYLVYGISYTIVVYALVELIVNIINRRPIRILFFNPTKLVLSFYIAVKLSELFAPYIQVNDAIMNRFVAYVILLILFSLFNTLIVNIVLRRPPFTYSYQSWKNTSLSELSSGMISLIYGLMLFLFGSQNRGEIDFFSFFFFYSPLVGLSLLSAVIARLRKEKSRLKALFTISSELNTMVPTDDFPKTLQTSFRDFINADAEVLWVKERDTWNLRFMQGDIVREKALSKEFEQLMETITKPIICHNRKEDLGIASSCFGPNFKSFVYAPLIIENELIGMLIVARSRAISFAEGDIRFIATFANQLAIVFKTRTLIQEKEKRLILEERNRIAREIHDGVAQSLAGVVMRLETAERKYRVAPEETLHSISNSILKLRESLKEVRESIYALRPYPTERVGLIAAFRKKIGDVMKEYGVEVRLKICGKEEALCAMAEKVLFDVFQESIANSIKHSGTTTVDVLLNYQPDQILLRVKDEGIGFSLFHAMIKAKNTAHFGILNMNESVETVNGSLEIDSKEGQGTEITVVIPKLD